LVRRGEGEGEGEGEEVATTGPNSRSNVEVAKPCQDV